MVEKTIIDEDVRILKEWYSKQNHLPQNIGDEYFYNFVCGTTSLEKAKRKIDAYFSMRNNVFDILTGVLPNTKTYKKLLKAHDMAILPDKTPEGYRVIFTAVRSKDASLFNYSSFLVRQLIMLEIAFQMWPMDTEYISIDDYNGLPAGAAKTVDLKHVIALGRLLLRGIPIKLKGNYSMNLPPFGHRVASLILPLLSKKLSSVVHIDSDASKVKELMPISMVPEEYGGQGKSLRKMSEYWSDLIDSREKWFQQKRTLCSDESKRLKDSFARETLSFGLEGSFKTLNID